MVLFIVAIAMALVMLAAMGFTTSMRIDHRTARLQADQRQVEQVAASAEEYLREWAGATRAARASYLTNNTVATWFRDVRVDNDPSGLRHGRFSLLTPQYSLQSPTPRFEFGIAPTSAKLSLEAILKWEQQSPGQGRFALMQLPGMTQEVADAILDWMDADDEPREFGAESEFYLGLFPPRQPPNRAVEQLDDLLAVRGVTAWQLFGNEEGIFTIRNPDLLGLGGTNDPADELLASDFTGDGAMLGDSAATRGESWNTPAAPWSFFLTVHSGERNETATGQTQIDLNQAQLSKLRQELTERFNEEIAEFVVAYRSYGRGAAAWDSATEGSIPSQASSRSAQAMISSQLDLFDAVVDVPDSQSSSSSSGRSIKGYRSPFNSRRAASEDADFVRFCDETTVGGDSLRRGRVNILNASRPVLMAIPGMTSELVEQLLTIRDQSQGADANRDDAVWLLIENVVDLETMRKLAPNVTVGGDVFQSQIIAYYDAQSPWVRCEVTIDGSSPGQPTVYFRDLRRLGRGFRQADLESPASETVTSNDNSLSPFGNAILPEDER
ncbi:MAG: general secretion pathway protein GspK [Planctomycetales bacterium]|nr:general secretion pathway protein GspK [Planctomycetales bacterium]